MAELTNIRIQTLSKAVPTAVALVLHKVNVVGNTLVVEDRQGVQYVLGTLYAENIIVETPPMPQECGCSTTNAQVLATLIKGVDGVTPDMSDYLEGYATEEYVDNAVEDVNVKGEDGYVYSNGEKVDMRFTRSLLPVGTSIPAKANLNTITYLKIGKYYCSLNVDAQTITNCPTSEAFSMEVFNPLGTNVDDETTKEYTYRVRVLTAYKTGMQYIQYCATSGTPGSWTYNSWRVVPQTSFSLASDKNGGSAVKGGSTRGVYIDASGTFQQMGYTIAKSVPSNAVFTDTNTKVTSVGNHYAPAEDADAAINAPEGEVVVGLKRDAAGHIVGIETTSMTDYVDDAIKSAITEALTTEV